MSGGWIMRAHLGRLLVMEPDLLMLDEPTNHLDLEMRQALTTALAEYEGSLVLVSHDRALLRTVCDDFLLVCDGNVEEFDGAIEDYINWLAARRAAHAGAGNAAGVQDKAARREARESAAADRQARLAARRPLLKEAEKLDKDLARLQQEKQLIDGQLADPAFYANPDPEKLRTLTTRQQQLAATIDAAEQRWLEVHTELENIGEA
jgi:ATP-binding cassette subfamily F protein 3